MNTCNISVIIPTYNRPNQLLEAIAKISACDPHPDEIIVHIDAGDNITEQAIQNSEFQGVRPRRDSVRQQKESHTG